MNRRGWLLLCGLWLGCDGSTSDEAVDAGATDGDHDDAGSAHGDAGGDLDAAAPDSGHDSGADSGPPPLPVYTLTNRATGKLLTAKSSGAIVQRSADGSGAQAWRLVAYDEHTVLVNVGSDQVLEANDVMEDGSVDPAIGQRELDHGERQQWAVVPTSPGHVNLVNRSSKLAADVQNGWLDDDTAIIQADTETSLTQQWKVSSDAGDLTLPAFTITNRQSGKLMTSQDAAVVQSAADGSAQQRWSMVTLDGVKLITNLAASLALEVPAPFETQGTELGLAKFDGGNNKNWSLVQTNAGYVRLVNSNSSMGAQVADGVIEDGAAVFQWSQHDGENQQWKVEAVP